MTETPVRRRKRRKKKAAVNQRLDIQGLRMVAVLLVFANHLFGFPAGGFIGVDVFLVISGFLITGLLLRMAETTGNVSFKRFYWNRIRRIVPAATVVLVVTIFAAFLLFERFRAHQIALDALFAFIFMSNWWFAARNTNYFAGSEVASPVQHFWSLSIEEQFYFVWPAVIFVIGLLVARKSLAHGDRMRIAGKVMIAITTTSFAWALFQSLRSPAWAYFDTFSRIWELGVGAVLATAVGALGRIPVSAKPILSWGGLAVIAVGALVIGEGSVGFPAPWGLLPVIGSAMVIAAGVNGEPSNQYFLRHRVSVYIGNISYSIYLIHWPVIVFLAAYFTAPGGFAFSVAAIALSFALAMASFHFVENPMRYGRSDPAETRRKVKLAAAALLTIGLAAFAARPMTVQVPEGSAAASAPRSDAFAPSNDPASNLQTPGLGPLGSAQQQQIAKALRATAWPRLDPSVEAVVKEPGKPEDIWACGRTQGVNGASCTWGSPSAAVRVALAGDSTALAYGAALRDIADKSNGRIQLSIHASAGCQFSDDWIFTADEATRNACPSRKKGSIDAIIAEKPDVLLISDSYGEKTKVGTERVMTAEEWTNGVRPLVDKVKGSVKKIVWLAPPPADKNIAECYPSKKSTPGDCVSRVTEEWASMAEAEQSLAKSVGGEWVDSRPWFCDTEGWCPAFVGTVPTKRDAVHMTFAYGQQISPVIAESLTTARVFG